MFAQCHSRKIAIKVVSDSFPYLLPKWVLQETALVAGSSPLIRLPPASARPLGLLPLGVSAPWTCANPFTFLLAWTRWLTKRVCPLKHILLEVANPLKLMIGHCKALDSYIAVSASPLIWYQWLSQRPNGQYRGHLDGQLMRLQMPSIPYM